MGYDDLDDLFGGEQDEFSEDSGARNRPCPVEPVPETPRSRILTLDAEDLDVQVFEDEDSGKILLSASVRNARSEPLQLEQAIVLLRDEAGRLLAIGEHHVDARFRRRQEIICEYEFGPDVIRDFHTLELIGRFGYPFRMRLAEGSLKPLESIQKIAHRRSWEMELKRCEPSLGDPEYDFEIAAYYGYRWSALAQFVIAMSERGDTAEDGEVVLALRDEEGKVLARESVSLSYLGVGPLLATANFDVERPQVLAARRLDVAIRGESKRCETLGVFRRSTK